MKLIIGLGNPGKKYERTRHNVGFLVIDELAMHFDVSLRNVTSVEAICGDIKLENEKILFCKPQTFMNASGKAMLKVMKKNGMSPNDLLVIYDDADLEFGNIRFRDEGSSGGHNGMQSILDLFPKGTAVARVRIGIGRPPHTDTKLESWVLGTWTEKEKEQLPNIIRRGADEIIEHMPV